jgi:hypothetical protein
MRLLRLLLIAGVAAAASGCAGYRLGPTNGQTAGEKSVQIVPFSNRTPEARLADAVTSALRKELQRDGTFRLVTREAGDIVVSGALIRYERHEVSLVPNDVATARDYNVSLTAQVTARERRSGKVIFDQPVTSRSLVRVTPNLPSSERQALPLLATEMARRVTALLADGSW